MMFTAPNSSEIEVAWLEPEPERTTELQQLQSEALAVQTEQDHRLGRLADELALKSALLTAHGRREWLGREGAKAETGSLQDQITL